jgi:hypothetical protein
LRMPRCAASSCQCFRLAGTRREVTCLSRRDDFVVQPSPAVPKASPQYCTAIISFHGLSQSLARPSCFCWDASFRCIGGSCTADGECEVACFVVCAQDSACCFTFLVVGLRIFRDGSLPITMPMLGTTLRLILLPILRCFFRVQWFAGDKLRASRRKFHTPRRCITSRARRNR